MYNRINDANLFQPETNLNCAGKQLLKDNSVITHLQSIKRSAEDNSVIIQPSSIKVLEREQGWG